MKSLASLSLSLLLGGLLLLGCENAGRDNILGVEATGVIRGFVFFDWSGVGEPADSLVPVPEVGLSVVDRSTGDTSATVTSDEEGVYRVAELPVGPYRVEVDPSTLADTVQIVRILDTPDVTVPPDDSVSVLVAVGFPKVSIAEARQLPSGTKVFVEGIALNAWNTFGDSTIHLLSQPGDAIRATRVRSVNVAAGDALRVRGTLSSREAQPVLDEARAFVQGAVGLPPAEPLTTAAAATADGGKLDAVNALVIEALITDTASVGSDFELTVDDGSGPLVVLLDASVNFRVQSFVPGELVNVSGLLVPSGPGVWILKPRVVSDLALQ